jgi:hypothetical protein
MRRSAGSSRGTVGRRSRRRAGRRVTIPMLAAAAVAMSAFGASAIGPDLPLQFRDTDRGIELVLDPAHIARVEVERTLYDHGRPVREQRLDLTPQRRQDGMAAIVVPLEIEQLSSMPIGYYAVRIAVVGAPSSPGAGMVPLRIERWVHVVVDRSGARRVSDREYSDAVDPAHFGRDGSGSQVPLHGGGGREARIPLRDTEHGGDIPLGRTGGAIEEQAADGRGVAPRGDERGER